MCRRITLTYLVKFFSEEMPGNYVPVNNMKKTYKPCSTAAFESAAEAVNAGMSYRRSWKNFDVKKSTFHALIKKGGVNSLRRPILLSAEDGKGIAELIATVAELRLSSRQMEIKLILKGSLDSKSDVSHCQDNMPGDDWFAGFMKRNKIYTRYDIISNVQDRTLILKA